MGLARVSERFTLGDEARSSKSSDTVICTFADAARPSKSSDTGICGATCKVLTHRHWARSGPAPLAVCSANAFQPPRGGGPRAVVDGLRLSKAPASVGSIALEFDGGRRRRCGLPPTLEGRAGTILEIQPVEGASLPLVHPGHSPWPLPSSSSLHLDDGQPSCIYPARLSVCGPSRSASRTVPPAVAAPQA